MAAAAAAAAEVVVVGWRHRRTGPAPLTAEVGLPAWARRLETVARSGATGKSSPVGFHRLSACAAWLLTGDVSLAAQRASIAEPGASRASALAADLCSFIVIGMVATTRSLCRLET